MLATFATICLSIILAINAPESSTLRIVSCIAASLESVMLLLLGILGAVKILHDKKTLSLSRHCSTIVFVVSLAVCVAAATAFGAALASLQSTSATEKRGDEAALSHTQRLLVGSCVAVALSTTMQAGFVIGQFLSCREATVGGGASCHSHEEVTSRTLHIKTIRYSHTSPSSETQEMTSVQPEDNDQSSNFAPMSLFKAAVSQAVRPVTSRTRLIAKNELRRPISMDSVPGRTSTDTSFDSWDTSSVDAHNRQVVLEMSSPPGTKTRVLETIPASPMVSRSPSPGKALDIAAAAGKSFPREACPSSVADDSDQELEAPQPIRRSNSFGSSFCSHRELSRLTIPSSASELHIHPLFRSDSPTPPPAATPGTSVVAAPNAGQVVSRQESMQSLRRIRSGSLPSSPLAQQASVEFPITGSTSTLAIGSTNGDEVGTLDRAGSASVVARAPLGERKMTPPVPEWLLSSTMKASLESYNKDNAGGDETPKK